MLLSSVLLKLVTVALLLFHCAAGGQPFRNDRSRNPCPVLPPVEESSEPPQSNAGRALVLTIIIFIMIFMVFVVILCALEYKRNWKLRRSQAAALKNQRFKEDLEKVKMRKERLQQQQIDPNVNFDQHQEEEEGGRRVTTV